MIIVLPNVNFFRFVVEDVWYYVPIYTGDSAAYLFEPTTKSRSNVIIPEWV